MAKSNVDKTNIRRKPFDFILVITVLVMLALAEGESSYKYVRTQGLAAFGGVILMYIISKIDYRIYKKFDKLAYGVSFLLLLAVLIPGFGMSSRRSDEMDIHKGNWYKLSAL